MDSPFIPFWSATTMFEESVVLIEDNHHAEGHLLFPPQSILSITNAARDQVYIEGRDFVVDPAKSTIARPPESRMPCLTRETIVATAGTLTHAHTIAVTYTHAPAQPVWQPTLGAGTLPRVSALLRRRAPLAICVTGDSISEGYDASGFHGFEPFSAPYPTLVADALERTCGARVTLRNRAVGGWTAADALEDTSPISAPDLDLVIVAFGMNDASYADADEFSANIRQLINRVRAAQPRVEFLVVAPMLPTPECAWVAPQRFEQYRSALMTLCGEGIRVADVTSIWGTMIARKDPHDLAGNGLNHPNDFGHRVYADVLVSSLTADVTAA